MKGYLQMSCICLNLYNLKPFFYKQTVSLSEPYLVEKKLGDFSFDEPTLSSFTFTVDEKKGTLNLNYQLDNTHKTNQFKDTTVFFK